MIDDLIDMLPNIPGALNQCWCFLHIVNLIAKTLLKQYNISKKDARAALDAAKQELLEIADGLDIEEMATMAKCGIDDKDDADNVDEWVDETEELTEEEIEEL